jgi:glycosyltransferase involved in cell wall biosynthesis
VIIASIRDQGAQSTPRQLFAQRQVCRLADCVLVNADSIRRWLIADGYNPSTIRVIPNGIDTARFTDAAPRSTVRADFGIPADAPIVAMLSRLTPNKGVDDMIDAAALLCHQRSDVRVVIVGAGPGSHQPAAQDDPFVAGVKQRVRDLGLGDRIIFTGYRGDIPSLLREVQVSVLPSLIEGLSNSVLESMAAGCAVVSTNVGGVGEAVVNGESGVLVPPSDVRSLAAAVRHLLEYPDEAKRMGRRARQTILDRYSIDRMVSATERLYTDLLARKAARWRRLRMPLVLRTSGVTPEVHLGSDSRGHISHD